MPFGVFHASLIFRIGEALVIPIKFSFVNVRVSLFMQVIKLGGSLTKSQALPEALNRIATRQGKMVIVPGGGAFADQVRFAQQQWQFNEVIAHEMAILAMQQMALLFKGLQPTFQLAGTLVEIKQFLSGQKSAPIIWSPSIYELNQAGVAANWEITSDSLAAWLAQQLDATELILVKAAKVTSNNLAQLSEQGIIDSAFVRFVDHARFTIQILSNDCFYEQQDFNRKII
jgi:aspartokinase-like uncharacterized kinase